MADGKWIEGLTPEMGVAEAATAVLAARFEVVRHFLPLAAEKPYDDPEYVHQLRVGTRRAAAALRVFADCLPRKHLRTLRRRLREIRRAAGDARDWDVFLLGFASRRSLDRGRRAAGARLPRRLCHGRALRGAGPARPTRRPRPVRRSWRRARHFPAWPTSPRARPSPSTSANSPPHSSANSWPGSTRPPRRTRATPPRCTGSASRASASGTRSRSSPAAFPPRSRTQVYPAVEAGSGDPRVDSGLHRRRRVPHRIARSHPEVIAERMVAPEEGIRRTVEGASREGPRRTKSVPEVAEALGETRPRLQARSSRRDRDRAVISCRRGRRNRPAEFGRRRKPVAGRQWARSGPRAGRTACSGRTCRGSPRPVHCCTRSRRPGRRGL